MSAVATTEKVWFRIDQPNKTKDVVEYSTDFGFFMKNQLIVWRSGTRHTFTSGLESKTFMKKLAFTREGIFDKEELLHYARTIHQEILNGKHGSGKLVE